MKNRKIPGMLIILPSFAPWIVYWIVGNILGIAIPLFICFTADNPTNPKKRF
ncbi:MAG: hypothetical protein ACP5JR_03380 [Thermoplasmata archaeon]